MKKPNITEGEWNEWFGIVKTPCGEYNIARCDTDPEFKRSELEANAKAISSVPEMIDALIEARQEIITMDNCLTMNHNNYDIKAIEVIDKALKKAGCTE